LQSRSSPGSAVQDDVPGFGERFPFKLRRIALELGVCRSVTARTSACWTQKINSARPEKNSRQGSAHGHQNAIACLPIRGIVPRHHGDSRNG